MPANEISPVENRKHYHLVRARLCGARAFFATPEPPYNRHDRFSAGVANLVRILARQAIAIRAGEFCDFVVF